MKSQTPKWVVRRLNSTHRVKFKFKEFMENENVTLEDIADHLQYTEAGVRKMIIRGTIKLVNITILQNTLNKKLDKYWSK